ncbi:hypothetical protein DFJ73DRAFT_766890, partial [Zopfochytrium polystomum]
YLPAAALPDHPGWPPSPRAASAVPLLRALLPSAPFSSSSPSSSFAATALVPLKTAGFHPTRGRRPHRPPGIYVYARRDDADIVSGWVATDGTWEPEITASIVEALAESEGLHLSDPLFVDVGSNVGVHSVVAAAWGSGSSRSTLCGRTPGVSGYAVYDAGIDGEGDVINNASALNPPLAQSPRTTPTKATAPSPALRATSPNTKPPPPPAAAAASAATASSPSGSGCIDPLDTFLAEDVWVMKMDVEGFELDVLRGATALFAARRVFFLVTEVMGGLAKTAEMLVELRRLVSRAAWTAGTGSGGRCRRRGTVCGSRSGSTRGAYIRKLEGGRVGAKADAALANV